MSKAAEAKFGEYVSSREFHALIRTIGHVHTERSTTYRILNTFYVADAEELLPILRLPVFSNGGNQAAARATGY
jgi:hypothetical protein